MALIPSLRGKKGLLGKKIVYKVADTETKGDTANQRATFSVAAVEEERARASERTARPRALAARLPP